MCGWMQGWMDGWIDVRMDAGMDGWMDGWMDGCVDGCRDGSWLCKQSIWKIDFSGKKWFCRKDINLNPSAKKTLHLSGSGPRNTSIVQAKVPFPW